MHFTTKFRQLIHQVHPQLSQIPLAKTTQSPAPGKWSPIEIIGHLIDSANNNHRRFTKAQFQDTLIFTGYAQDKWVTAQHYTKMDWQQLLDFWKLYNLHICHIMENTTEEKLKRVVKEHNLHQIAMVTVPADQPTTLSYFMKDYIFHIEHHLQQITDIVRENFKV